MNASPASVDRGTASGRILRVATPADLDAINALIGRAVMTWNLAERVKRLALPSYHYNGHDLDHVHIVVAEDRAAALLGIAAWEAATSRDCPPGRRGLLLHGLYVDPAGQRRGVGSALLAAALTAAREQGYDGLLVKAQADAEAFFQARGLRRLAADDPERDYPNRYWIELALSCTTAFAPGTRCGRHGRT